MVPLAGKTFGRRYKPQDSEAGFYLSESLNHLAAGYYQVTLFANAIPSQAHISVAAPIAP